MSSESVFLEYDSCFFYGRWCRQLVFRNGAKSNRHLFFLLEGEAKDRADLFPVQRGTPSTAGFCHEKPHIETL